MKFTCTKQRKKSLNCCGGLSPRRIMKESTKRCPPSFSPPIPAKPGIPCAKRCFRPEDKTHDTMLPTWPMFTGISVQRHACGNTQMSWDSPSVQGVVMNSRNRPVQTDPPPALDRPMAKIDVLVVKEKVWVKPSQGRPTSLGY